jgi:hypothetical protein
VAIFEGLLRQAILQYRRGPTTVPFILWFQQQFDGTPHATVPSPKVPHGVHQLATELADVKPMRRGSLSQRAIKCGKTHSRFPTREQAVAAKRQIEADSHLRGLRAGGQKGGSKLPSRTRSSKKLKR